MSKLSVDKSGRVNTVSPLRILIMVMAILVLFIYLAGPRPIPRDRAYQVKCQACLKSLYVSFTLYAEEFDGKLPSIESWCDALGKYMVPESLICPSSNAKEGQSSYAMNEYLDGKKLAELPPDLVLLFECEPAWNKAGGPEMLTTKHYEGKACNVLFTDGDLKSIVAGKISDLKWLADENKSDE